MAGIPEALSFLCAQSSSQSSRLEALQEQLAAASREVASERAASADLATQVQDLTFLALHAAARADASEKRLASLEASLPGMSSGPARTVESCLPVVPSVNETAACAGSLPVVPSVKETAACTGSLPIVPSVGEIAVCTGSLPMVPSVGETAACTSNPGIAGRVRPPVQSLRELGVCASHVGHVTGGQPEQYRELEARLFGGTAPDQDQQRALALKVLDWATTWSSPEAVPPCAEGENGACAPPAAPRPELQFPMRISSSVSAPFPKPYPGNMTSAGADAFAGPLSCPLSKGPPARDKPRSEPAPPLATSIPHPCDVLMRSPKKPTLCAHQGQSLRSPSLVSVPPELHRFAPSPAPASTGAQRHAALPSRPADASIGAQWQVTSSSRPPDASADVLALHNSKEISGKVWATGSCAENVHTASLQPFWEPSPMATRLPAWAAMNPFDCWEWLDKSQEACVTQSGQPVQEQGFLDLMSELVEDDSGGKTPDEVNPRLCRK